jgi:hypothetical protein
MQDVFRVGHPAETYQLYSGRDWTTRTVHRKKRFRCFPFPSRDVTYQTLSRREYVSLIKPEVSLSQAGILTESF